MEIEIGESTQLGIDVGGTAIRTGVVKNGAIMAGTFARIEHRGDAVGVLNDVIRNHSRNARSLNRNIKTIAIALAGNIDPTTGIIASCPTIPTLQGRSLEGIIDGARDISMKAYNDATARAFAEWHALESHGCRNLIAIFVGTGIGGGVVLGGNPVLGEHGAAVEAGHIGVERLGYPCLCGGQGCVERYSSGPAILQRANDLASAVGRNRFQTAETLAHALMREDEIALRAYSEAAGFLSMAAATLINVFDPSVVVLGGGVIDAAPNFFDAVVDGTRERLMALPKQYAKFRKTVLGDKGGLLGAALLSTKQTS